MSGNYMRMLGRAADLGLISLEQGQVSEISVEHDEWCPRTPCICKPDLIIEGKKHTWRKLMGKGKRVT